MALVLDEFERRVLGVLIEKSLTQPEHYPMSLNALVSGCNQKSNRDPVMDLDEDVVSQTVDGLREKKLVTHVLPGGGARVGRYKHDLRTALGWEKREQAVLCELLLRGPQTPGELRGRCSRMMPFEDVNAIMIVLDLLAGYDAPLVRALAREPGRSAIRYDHCLYPADELPSGQAGDADATARTVPARDAAPHPPSAGSASLISEIGALREALAALTRRVERLEQGGPSVQADQ